MLETEDFHAAILQELDKNRSLKQGDMPSWHDHFLNLWDTIKKAETARDESDLMEYHKTVRHQHKSYIRKTDQWLMQKQAIARSSELDNEVAVKIRAGDIKPKFEKGLYRYSLCFLYLNRLLIHAKRDISAVLKFQENAPKKLPEVNQNIGFLLKRAYTEKKKLMVQRQKLVRMTHCLKQLETLFENLETSMESYLGHEDGSRAYTAFRGSLRHMHFEQAGQRIGNAIREHSLKKGHLFCKDRSGEIITLAKHIIHLLKTNQDDLKREEDMALDSSELRLLFTLLQTSETRVQKFIDKYTAAYLAFQFQFLLKQAFRLGQIGSFERLFVLHQSLIKGTVTAFHQPKELQEFETEIVRRAEYILSARMVTIPDIFDQVEAAQAQLYQVLQLIHDCHKPVE